MVVKAVLAVLAAKACGELVKEGLEELADLVAVEAQELAVPVPVDLEVPVEIGEIGNKVLPAKKHQQFLLPLLPQSQHQQFLRPRPRPRHQKPPPSTNGKTGPLPPPLRRFPLLQ